LDALVKAEGFSAEATVVGVRSAWVTVKTHRLPSMSKRELDKALEFEVPELIPRLQRITERNLLGGADVFLDLTIPTIQGFRGRRLGFSPPMTA
jgi:hypothetical protein